MHAHEAKDFLVDQVIRQAALENVSFSDLERRMMYFTEEGDLAEDPVKLNEDFAAAYETDEFESKVSSLMHHAYKRVKKENPELARRWDDAVRTLRQGDHYVLVPWNQGLREPQNRPPYDSVRLLGAGILVVTSGVLVILAWEWLRPHLPRVPQFPHLIPDWLGSRVLGFFVVALYFVGLYFWRKERD